MHLPSLGYRDARVVRFVRRFVAAPFFLARGGDLRFGFFFGFGGMRIVPRQVSAPQRHM